MTNLKLTPSSVIKELHNNGVTHVVWLPDSETNFMFQEMSSDSALNIVSVCREGECLAIAAGLWVGGMTPIVMIQNTGLFESGDSIRGLGLDVELPVVMMIGYRGWKRHGQITDSAAHFTEPILKAWHINYHLIETDNDTHKITLAFKEANTSGKPVVCLMGSEYN